MRKFMFKSSPIFSKATTKNQKDSLLCIGLDDKL